MRYDRRDCSASTARVSKMPYLEVLLLALLILINGLLAMSELAVVSSRKSRLRHMAERGNKGARSAVRLVEDPSGFLSTVQVGITLVGVLAGAFGGATIADTLGDQLDGVPALAPHGDAIAIGIVVVCITYLSIVFGELVPKRIALANPERMAAIAAGPMRVLSRSMAPAVWLLKASTEASLRLLRMSRTREATITEDEVKSLIAEGTRAGIFVPQEREMIEAVLRLADRSVRVIMTPRTEVVWIEAGADRDTVARAVAERRFSRLLVCRGSIDHAVGTIHTKDLLQAALKGLPLDVKSLMTPVLNVSNETPVLKLLDQFRRDRIHMAVVIDQRRTTQGIVTLTDVLESIAGEFPEVGETFEIPIVQRGDGSWLVDGGLPIDELEDRLQLPGLREETQFDTVGGFVLQQFGRLPGVGDSFGYRNARFEVVDMDGRRVDKVLIRFETPIL
jgi:putative hemolysin